MAGLAVRRPRALVRRRLSLEDLRTELQRVYKEQVMPAESPAEETQPGV